MVSRSFGAGLSARRAKGLASLGVILVEAVLCGFFAHGCVVWISCVGIGARVAEGKAVAKAQFVSGDS